VLEIGCGTGELLNAVQPSYGVGVDFFEEMIKIASASFPAYKFMIDDIEELRLNEKFDYVIMSDLAMSLWDIQKAFQCLHNVCHEKKQKL
jgi:ubiquinone/menaquinone biosynthesis C-methylase UbiE